MSIHPLLRLEAVSPSSWVKVWSNNKFKKLLKTCLSFTLKLLHCDSIQISCWGGFNVGEETWNLVYSEWDSFLENKTYWAGWRQTLPLSLFVEIGESDSATIKMGYRRLRLAASVRLLLCGDGRVLACILLVTDHLIALGLGCLCCDLPET